jgi:hypothetical protein
VQRPLPHARDSLAAGARWKSTPVVAHDEAQSAVHVVERYEHVRGPRVAHYVGEALLGNPVDHELELGADLGAPEVQYALHAQPLVTRGLRAEFAQRALEPQVFKRLGPQLAGDAAHVLEAAPDCLAGAG